MLAAILQKFVEQEKWPPNSLDLNPVDYSVWGALQLMAPPHKILDIHRLKCMLFDCWTQLCLDTLN